jgi:DNA-directed RNA polymerase specialized sigma24 family protein
MGARPAWPEQLRRLAADFLDHAVRFSSPADTDRAESALWVLLQTAIGGYLAYEIKNPEIRRDELPGLAAEKTAQLVEQIKRGAWTPTEENDVKIRAYIKQVASNTARAFWKRYYRSRGAEELTETLDQTPETVLADPEEQAAGEEAAARLHEWLGTCKEAHAWIFVMKAFYQMRTREIAEHPRVRTSPTNVDTVWDRLRKELRTLLSNGGEAPARFPQGTFAAFLRLWEPLSRGGEANV